MISLRHEVLWRGKPIGELNGYEMRDALTWAALEIERLRSPIQTAAEAVTKQSPREWS